MSAAGFARVMQTVACELREGDRLHTSSMTGIGQPWMEVRRLQRLGDGHIRVATELSDFRMSPGMPVRVMRGSEHRGGRSDHRSGMKWRTR